MRRDERAILPKALAQARIVTWVYNPQDASLRTSPNAAEIFGLVPGISLRNPEQVVHLLHPDDRPIHLARVELAHQQASNYTSRFRMVRPDNGEVMHVEEHGFAHGGVLSGIILDVTERTRLESRQQFLVQLDDATRPLSDALEITHTYARLLGQYLDVNRCAYADVEEDEDTFNLTGDWNHGVDSIVGRYTFSQFGNEGLRLNRAGQAYVVEDAESDARVVDVLDSYRATKIRAAICVGLLKAGRFVAALAVHQARPRRWRQDEVELVTQVANRCWESIERARLERDRKLSAERYRTLVDSLSSLVWMTDPRGLVIEPNPSWEQFTGQTFAEYRERGWLDALHPEDRATVGDIWRATLEKQMRYEATYRLRRHDGSYRMMEVFGTPVFDDQGQLREWVGSCTDVSERHRLEEQREQLLLAERRANQAKEEFLATLSHEMRTPLSAVLGWAQMLAGGGLTPEENQSGLETIQRNVKSLTQLIEDLLDTARIESGKIRLELAGAELGPVVAATFEALRPQAVARGVTLLALDCEPASVWVDVHRLEQMLVNLVGNGIKFTPAGGVVRVGYKLVEGMVEIRVSDTGIGIRPEFLPNVFDRFRQSDSSSTRQYGGLGLGLAIVKDLAALHGGSVRAFSLGENQGATFTLTLPVGSRPGVAAPLAASVASDLSGVTILAVDDDRDGRELLQKLLERRGARVLSADSVSQAMHILQGEKPDLLVSDISMPDQDGYDLIRNVRRRWSDRQLPALALTALARSADRQRTLAAGFQKHLCKPVHPEQLMQVLSGLLEA
ncbi:MAG: PAS domain-containing protein [Candidatus Eremiobacteraeota bacterium]|nr:PAS domain-containing protein [Candidatus Eremiobacteraeota bacterium]